MRGAGSSGGKRVRGRRLGGGRHAVVVQHGGPRVAQHGDVTDDLLHAFGPLLHIAFPETAVEIIVEPAKGDRAVAALFHVQGEVQLADDVLRPLKIVVDNGIRFRGIVAIESANRRKLRARQA